MRSVHKRKDQKYFNNINGMCLHFFREVETGAHTIWLDNFCKKPQSFQIANVDRGTFKAPLWTGKAVRKCRNQISMDVIRCNQVVVPAMPDDILVERDTLMQMYRQGCDDKGINMYDTSLTTKYEVQNVPVKPHPDKVVLEKHKRALTDRHDSLETFYPAGIINMNIGSNRGFLRIMRHHYKEKSQDSDQCDRYSAFCVEIDIFNKMLKVGHNMTVCSTYNMFISLILMM